MTDALRLRGPDGAGAWEDAAAGVALGHRRLAIIDPTPDGSQPMQSTSGRYCISFNGEIYNFRELRGELQALGAVFRGRSDTEIMLAAIDAWGLEKAIGRFAGMFAFALWDRERRLLHLVRDRLGEKPLYFGPLGDGATAFASELTALRAHPAWTGRIDREALRHYLRLGYVPAPLSIFENVRKVLPGTYVTLDCSRDAVREDVTVYWSVEAAARAGYERPFAGTDSDAEEECDSVLREIVAQQMVADVPLGAFLSGGVDSSTIVSLMQATSDRPVRTFTIGFGESGYDEATYARAVAAHLGTEHTEVYLSAEQALSAVPTIACVHDEPFADPSQLPTRLVSSIARRDVTVCLSGDGGDESFGGYNRYAWAERVWRSTRWAPAPVRASVGSLIRAVPARRWNSAMDPALRRYVRDYRPSTIGERVHKIGAMVACENFDALYESMVTQWPYDSIVADGVESGVRTALRRSEIGTDPLDRMMLLDTVGYLPDDILTKVDRASMNVSLEARAPLVDHRLVEFAWRLPRRMKVRGGQSKWLLRRVLGRYVPDRLIDRPKMGFGVPIADWLRGPLRGWAESLLDPNLLQRDGLLRSEPIRRAWAEHLAGTRNWETRLWPVLMLNAWIGAV